MTALQMILALYPPMRTHGLDLADRTKVSHAPPHRRWRLVTEQRIEAITDHSYLNQTIVNTPESGDCTRQYPQRPAG